MAGVGVSSNVVLAVVWEMVGGSLIEVTLTTKLSVAVPASPSVSDHPLGCHRRRVSDKLCFRGILIRLVTGCSWVDAVSMLRTQIRIFWRPSRIVSP